MERRQRLWVLCAVAVVAAAAAAAVCNKHSEVRGSIVDVDKIRCRGGRAARSIAIAVVVMMFLNEFWEFSSVVTLRSSRGVAATLSLAMFPTYCDLGRRKIWSPTKFFSYLALLPHSEFLQNTCYEFLREGSPERLATFCLNILRR